MKNIEYIKFISIEQIFFLQRKQSSRKIIWEDFSELTYKKYRIVYCKTLYRTFVPYVKIPIYTEIYVRLEVLKCILKLLNHKILSDSAMKQINNNYKTEYSI